MYEWQYWYPFRHRIIILFFGITDSIFGQTSVSSANYENVIVRIIDYVFNKFKLLFVESGEVLHSSRNAIDFHKGVKNDFPLLSQIRES